MKKLGSGGQGDVFLVLHPDRAAAETKALHEIDNALRQGSALAQSGDKRLRWSIELARGVAEVTRPHEPEELGAAVPTVARSIIRERRWAGFLRRLSFAIADVAPSLTGTKK